MTPVSSNIDLATRAAAAVFVSTMLIGAILMGAGSVSAQQTPPGGQETEILPQWSISGSNTFRFEQYEIGGDESSSSFAFEGPQPYDDLFLNFSSRVSP